MTNSVIPFIDAHSHLHGFPHDAWETIGATGIAATVLSCGNPHEHREVFDKPPNPDDIRRLWDHPIKLAPLVEERHGFRVFIAVGISSMTKVDRWEQLVDVLPTYLGMPRVVALGEGGLDPTQYFGLQWSLEEQKECLAEQLRVAKEHDVPFILHTPKLKNQKDYTQPLVKWDVPASRYKRYVLDKDLAVVHKVGLDHRRLVVDHADDTIIEYVLRETGAHVGIRVAQVITDTPPRFFADMVERYGPDRIMINSDYIIYSSCDLLAIPKTIREMRRRGIDEVSIRRVVYDNANEFYRLGMPLTGQSG